MGFWDVNGNLRFMQRKEKSIRVRGEWVFIQDVEKVIESHPKVQQCAVVGISGGMGGDEIKAVIELKPGASLRPEEIIAHCGKDCLFYDPQIRRMGPGTSQDGSGRKGQKK